MKKGEKIFFRNNFKYVETMISGMEEIIMMYDYNYLNEKAKPYGGINKIFNELSDYAEEFIIGYLEAKCGCKVSKEDVIKEATFTSVWNGGYEITTSCKVNTVRQRFLCLLRYLFASGYGRALWSWKVETDPCTYRRRGKNERRK